jgi:hypothetical protein
MGQKAASGVTLPENGGFARVQSECGVFSKGKKCGLAGLKGVFLAIMRILVLLKILLLEPPDDLP